MPFFGSKTKRKREEPSPRWIPIPFIPKRFRFIAPLPFEGCVKQLRAADVSHYRARLTAGPVLDVYPLNNDFCDFHFEQIHEELEREGGSSIFRLMSQRPRTVEVSGPLEMDGQLARLDLASTIVTGTVKWRRNDTVTGAAAVVLGLGAVFLITLAVINNPVGRDSMLPLLFGMG